MTHARNVKKHSVTENFRVPGRDSKFTCVSFIISFGILSEVKLQTCENREKIKILTIAVENNLSDNQGTVCLDRVNLFHQIIVLNS